MASRQTELAEIVTLLNQVSTVILDAFWTWNKKRFETFVCNWEWPNDWECLVPFEFETRRFETCKFRDGISDQECLTDWEWQWQLCMRKLENLKNNSFSNILQHSTTLRDFHVVRNQFKIKFGVLITNINMNVDVKFEIQNFT